MRSILNECPAPDHASQAGRGAAPGQSQDEPEPRDRVAAARRSLEQIADLLALARHVHRDRSAACAMACAVAYDEIGATLAAADVAVRAAHGFGAIADLADGAVLAQAASLCDQFSFTAVLGADELRESLTILLGALADRRYLDRVLSGLAGAPRELAARILAAPSGPAPAAHRRQIRPQRAQGEHEARQGVGELPAAQDLDPRASHILEPPEELAFDRAG